MIVKMKAKRGFRRGDLVYVDRRTDSFGNPIDNCVYNRKGKNRVLFGIALENISEGEYGPVDLTPRMIAG